MSESRRKQFVFWGIVALWVTADVITKRVAEAQLLPQRSPHEVFGQLVRFTLVYNQGAAFGMDVGPASRWIFTLLTIGALAMLAHLFRETLEHDMPRIVALGLVTAGAIGNLIDRLSSSKGVIDFIDIGVTGWRFWTFNVADVGVSCGAVLLALVLWREERQRHAAPEELPVTVQPPPQPQPRDIEV